MTLEDYLLWPSMKICQPSNRRQHNEDSCTWSCENHMWWSPRHWLTQATKGAILNFSVDVLNIRNTDDYDKVHAHAASQVLLLSGNTRTIDYLKFTMSNICAIVDASHQQAESLTAMTTFAWFWWLNSLAPGRCGSNFKRVISKHVTDSVHEHFLWNSFQLMPQNSGDDMSNIGSGNGLVSLSTKSDPDLCCHMV